MFTEFHNLKFAQQHPELMVYKIIRRFLSIFNFNNERTLRSNVSLYLKDKWRLFFQDSNSAVTFAGKIGDAMAFIEKHMSEDDIRNFRGIIEGLENNLVSMPDLSQEVKVVLKSFLLALVEDDRLPFANSRDSEIQFIMRNLDQ